MSHRIKQVGEVQYPYRTLVVCLVIYFCCLFAYISLPVDSHICGFLVFVVWVQAQKSLHLDFIPNIV